MTPDTRAVAAFEALRREAWAEALAHAEAISAPDRPALAARAAAYRAQALRELGRLEDAERAAADAVQLAKRAGDTSGVSQLRVLHASILQGVTATRLAAQEQARDAPLADTADEVLLAPHRGPDRAAALVRKACALADAGRRDEALAAAARAGEEAHRTGTPREEVLALLCAARVADDPAASIHAAHAVADAADDMNLVTAVAKAAKAAGVTLAAPRFG